MEGKVVLVTGGASGLGAAVVEAFQAAGAKVAAMDLVHVPKADLSVCGDVAIKRDWERAVSEIKNWAGKWDILIGTAGIQPLRMQSEETTYQLLEQFTAVLAKSMIYGTQMAKESMEHYGCVINSSAFTVTNSRPNYESYLVSESLVEELTKASCNELSFLGIRVNAIIPRLFSYNQSRVIDRSEFDSRVVRAASYRARELARVLVYLCRDESARITGSILPHDGEIVAAWLESESRMEHQIA